MWKWWKISPHKAERDKEIQEVRESRMPKVLPGFSSGKLPGGSKAESGKERNEEGDGVRWVEKEVTNAVLIANLIGSTTGGVLVGKWRRSVMLKEAQMENEPEERDAMEWLMYDDLMRQWEEISKYQEKITLKKSGRREATGREGAKCTKRKGARTQETKTR